MTVKLSTGLRNNMAGAKGFAESFKDGVLHIYSGPQPLSPDNAATGTLLAIITKDGGAFTPGAPDNGLVFDTPANGTVAKKAADTWKGVGLAAGNAGYFRLMGNAADTGAASATLPRMDGSCGTSGADLNLSNIAFAVGAPQSVDVFAFTVPAQ